MHHIILVFSKHKESGNCNSIELYKIIEMIKPEIIFEELSYSNFDKIYHGKSFTTLETDAIKKYLENNHIEHIPVDTFDIPENHHEQVNYMYNKIFGERNIFECSQLRSLYYEQSLLEDEYGLNFLNSYRNEYIFTEADHLTKEILNKINNEKLFCIYESMKEIIERREDEIINNIYNHSKSHIYNKAIQFIGSGHMKSFIEKIKKRSSQSETQVKWTFYSDCIKN